MVSLTFYAAVGFSILCGIWDFAIYQSPFRAIGAIIAGFVILFLIFWVGGWIVEKVF